MLTYDTCTRPGLALGGALDLYPQIQAQDVDCSPNPSKIILGKRQASES